MKDNFIKGFLYKEIYRNEINGYMVGLFKIKDNNIDYDDDMIHITGILPRLSEKKEYILYGEIVYHNKYGKQFNVNSFEVNIPTKEEELIVFLSSDLFPIGEKTAKKIVDTFHEDTINKILENKDCLQLIPRLGENKINRIYNVLVDYQSTSNIVMELTKLGFDMRDSLSFLNKYNNKILDTVNNNIYELIDKSITDDPPMNTKDGGYIKGYPEDFDRESALNQKDLFKFIEDTQSKEWNRYKSTFPDDYESRFVKRFNEEVVTRGIIDVIRNGIADRGFKFKLAYFMPETDLVPENWDLYNKNILNETRQLKYSTQNENSIDIVLLLNGIPVVALELKNQITGQNSENAQKQFMYDRDPRELIFRFNSRIIAYFAVDHYDVKYTTKLAGKDTYYLPFNQGSNGAGNVGGAGNPTNESGYTTDYLWKNVLKKDSLMEILHKFIHLQVKEEIEHRKLVVRPEAIEAVKEARAQGDLSENFEYYAAKKDKNKNEGRIRYLERVLKTATIISDESADDEVGLNNTVQVYFEDDDETETFKIVSTMRGDSISGRISGDSPMGAALMGHKVGDRVEVKVNEKVSYYVVIKSIENTGEEETDTIRTF